MKLSIIIQECHRNLGVLREAWQDAEPERKAFWMNRINRALEELHHYMAKRSRPTRRRK